MSLHLKKYMILQTGHRTGSEKRMNVQLTGVALHVDWLVKASLTTLRSDGCSARTSELSFLELPQNSADLQRYERIYVR